MLPLRARTSFALRRTLLALAVAALLAACGIKGSLRLPPAAQPSPPTTPDVAVPAPNAPTPGQQPPAPVEPRVPVQ